MYRATAIQCQHIQKESEALGADEMLVCALLGHCSLVDEIGRGPVETSTPRNDWTLVDAVQACPAVAQVTEVN